MKAKNFLMTILLVMGFVSAKAQVFPPELVLVSQPVMTYNDYSITVYYDLQNIGDVRYKGNIYIYLSPDDGYYYAKEYVKIRPGRIKRVAIEIPAYRPNPSTNYMVMPYYSLNGELYSFTTFEYFEPLTFHWYGPRTEVFYVTVLPPRPLYYTRPHEYRFYYDGYRPMLPPPGGPMHPIHHEDPLHHTYHWHHNNGGYPGTNPGGHGVPPKPNEGNGNSGNNGHAVVRPPVGGNTSGSMSTPASNGNNNGANVNNSSNGGSLSRPAGNNTNNGATTRPNSGNSNAGSGSVSRPSSGSNSSATRPNSTTTTRPSGNTNNNSGTVSRPSSGNSSSSTRPSTTGSSSVSRPSGNTNNNSGTVSRPSSSSGSASARPSTSSSSSSNRSGSNSNSRGSSSSNASSSGSRSGNSGANRSGR